jgi:hypothetical protein
MMKNSHFLIYKNTEKSNFLCSRSVVEENIIVTMVKVEVKLSLCLTKYHAMTYWGGGITPSILSLGTRWR